MSTECCEGLKLKEYKWVVATGFMLWCIVFIFGFNTLIAFEVCRFAFVNGDLVYATLPTWFILTYIVTTRVVKPTPRVKLVLGLFHIALFFAVAWSKAVEWGIINYEYTWGTFLFTLVFTTGFTIIYTTVSMLAVKTRYFKRKTANNFIAELVEKEQKHY